MSDSPMAAGTGARTDSHGQRTSTAVLPAEATAARQGRAFVLAFCAREDIADAVADDVVLAVSEVVTNVWIHARTDSRLTITFDGQVLRLEVADGSRVGPTARRSTRDATGGRGMIIVDALAARWGSSPSGSGKIVWFEFDT